MELEISKRALILASAAAVVALLLGLGYILSPRVDGRPVLLLPANWRVTRYLSRAERWLAVLEEEQARLAGMVPPSETGREGEGELPPFPTPPAAETIYQRSRILNRSLVRLERVRQEMEEAEAPKALEALHALAVATADEVLKLHAAVSTALSSPSQGSRERAEAQAQTAADHLLALRRALWAQLALLGRATVTPTPTCTPTPTPPPHIYLPLVMNSL